MGERGCSGPSAAIAPWLVTVELESYIQVSWLCLKQVLAFGAPRGKQEQSVSSATKGFCVLVGIMGSSCVIQPKKAHDSNMGRSADVFARYVSTESGVRDDRRQTPVWSGGPFLLPLVCEMSLDIFRTSR